MLTQFPPLCSSPPKIHKCIQISAPNSCSRLYKHRERNLMVPTFSLQFHSVGATIKLALIFMNLDTCIQYSTIRKCNLYAQPGAREAMKTKKEAATDCESEQTCVTGKLSEITAECPDLLPYLWQWEVINANDCRACKNKTKKKNKVEGLLWARPKHLCNSFIHCGG